MLNGPRLDLCRGPRRREISFRLRGLSTPWVWFVQAESGVDLVALREASLRMGLTQYESLARLINVAGGERILRWELGSSAPRPEILHGLAQALDVAAADLSKPGDATRLT